MVYSGQDPKNDLDITSREGRRDREGVGLSTVREGEEGLGVVCDDHHPLAERVFMMGGSYEALKLNGKHTINMKTRLALNIHGRREGSVKPGRYIFIQKFGMEGLRMEFLKRSVWGEK